MSFLSNIFSSHAAAATHTTPPDHSVTSATPHHHQEIMAGGCIKSDHSTGPFNPPHQNPFDNGGLNFGPPTNIQSHNQWNQGHQHAGPGLY